MGCGPRRGQWEGSSRSIAGSAVPGGSEAGRALKGTGAFTIECHVDDDLPYSSDQIRTDVELSLRRNGIRVLDGSPPDEWVVLARGADGPWVPAFGRGFVRGDL